MYGENILRASFPGKKINPPRYFPLYPYPYVGQQSFLCPLAWFSGMGNEEKPGRPLQPGTRGGLPGRSADRTRPEIGPREYGSERGRIKKSAGSGLCPDPAPVSVRIPSRLVGRAEPSDRRVYSAVFSAAKYFEGRLFLPRPMVTAWMSVPSTGTGAVHTGDCSVGRLPSVV